jgi:hypothetical protein
MITRQDVLFYNLNAYFREKNLFFIVWHFNVTKDAYFFLEVKYHPIGQL